MAASAKRLLPVSKPCAPWGGSRATREALPQAPPAFSAWVSPEGQAPPLVPSSGKRQVWEGGLEAGGVVWEEGALMVRAGWGCAWQQIQAVTWDSD